MFYAAPDIGPSAVRAWDDGAAPPDGGCRLRIRSEWYPRGSKRARPRLIIPAWQYRRWPFHSMIPCDGNSRMRWSVRGVDVRLVSGRNKPKAAHDRGASSTQRLRGRVWSNFSERD